MSKLTPLAIAKRTPLTNCGHCGQPTCLAFGAAVVKTGLSLELCPFIDLTGLDLTQTPRATPQSPGAKDLEFIASLKEKIRPLNLARLAPQLGATHKDESPDTLFFRYLGQEVALSKTILLLDGREPEDPRDQILLYNYVFSQGQHPPATTGSAWRACPTPSPRSRRSPPIAKRAWQASWQSCPARKSGRPSGPWAV